MANRLLLFALFVAHALIIPPQPETWVHFDDPCEANYDDGQSLAALVLPTIVTRTNITRDHLHAVVETCRSLFRSKESLKNATFHQHLMTLDRWDGLRLATAQMTISSSARACDEYSRCYLAGGDILRMAQNIIKFQNLRKSTSIPRKQRLKFHVLTTSMEEHIASPGNNTLRFLDFVLAATVRHPSRGN